MRRFAALVLAITLVACDTGIEPNINFTHSLLPSGPAENNASVVGSARAVFAVGVLVAPNGCQRLEANHKVTGTVITLTISSSATNSDCVPGRGAYSYTFSLEGLNRGIYTAKVVYNFGSQQPAVTVTQAEVRIT